MSEYIEAFIGGNWHLEWTLPVKSKGTDCVLAALTAIQRSDNQADLLRDCIAFTGDVDTVAAIALGMITFSTEVEANLPPWMYEELENGPLFIGMKLNSKNLVYQFGKYQNLTDEKTIFNYRSRNNRI